MIIVKEQLQQLRKSKGLTQRETADIFGVKLTTYQKYELDVISPPYDTLIKIADFYGVSTDYLLGREEQPKPLEQLYKMYDFKMLEKALSENYLNLPQEKREDFVEFLYKTVQLAKLDTPSVTSEETNKKEFQPEHANMSIEEIEAQANYWDALYEKKQAESASQEQGEHSELA